MPYYWKFFDLERCFFVSADKSVSSEQDIMVDLEKALPIPSNTYDALICLSVLEHVYSYLQLLKEIKRIKKDNGCVFFWIPFFMQPHGTPEYSDYFRYTDDALAMLFEEVGYEYCEICIVSNFFWVIGNILSQPLYSKKMFFPLLIITNLINFMLGKLTQRFQKQQWPIGYFAVAR